MNPPHPPTLKALCARAGLLPSKAAGQNFLIHGGTLETIVDEVLRSGGAPSPPSGGHGGTPLQQQGHHTVSGDVILEVGAGFGVLTTALADRGARVIAIERDARIVPILREQVAEHPRVEVVEGDVLHLLKEEEFAVEHGVIARSESASDEAISVNRTPGLPRPRGRGLAMTLDHWKLVANLPYSITSDFLRLLFDTIGTGALPPPERVVLLLQHEVVERLLGRTQGDVGLLTMIARLHCARIHRIAKVPASHFWPPPKVASAVVTLEGWRSPEEIAMLLNCRSGGAPSPPVVGLDCRSGGAPSPPSGQAATAGRPYAESCSSSFIVHRSAFLSLLTRAFSHPRRQLQNNLDLPPAAWATAGVDPTARPATLTLDQWMALAREMM